MAENLLVATKTFMAVIDGKRVKVTKGRTRVSADHELVKGREHLFKPADTTLGGVEDATARPGQKRDDAAAKPLEKMTSKELQAHAAAAGIDLGKAKKKADMVAAITAATEVVDADAGATGEGESGEADAGATGEGDESTGGTDSAAGAGADD